MNLFPSRHIPDSREFSARCQPVSKALSPPEGVARCRLPGLGAGLTAAIVLAALGLPQAVAQDESPFGQPLPAQEQGANQAQPPMPGEVPDQNPFPVGDPGQPQDANQVVPPGAEEIPTDLEDGASAINPLRAQFERSASAALLPELEVYAQSLARLEQQLAQRGDWRGAIQTRDERLEVENRILSARARIAEPVVIDAPTNRPATPSVVTLNPAEATLAGGVELASSPPALVNWSADSTATWSLPGLDGGGYEVVFEYASTNDAGEFTIGEEFFTLTGELAATGDPETYRRINLGTLKIRTGDGSLTLGPVANGSPPGDLRLKSVVLVPASL